MQFHIAQTKIFLRTPSFPIQGVPMNNLAPMKNCPGGVQGNLNWMPGYYLSEILLGNYYNQKIEWRVYINYILLVSSSDNLGNSLDSEGLIWIQTIWHSDVISLRTFLKIFIVRWGGGGGGGQHKTKLMQNFSSCKEFIRDINHF